MDILIITTAVLQSIAVALGVGNSTSAVVSFFVAISDGEIDKSERRIMGVTYSLLRIAMILILITTAILTLVQFTLYGTAYFTPFVVGFWLLIFVLFFNAFLMTIHKMPMTFGPALQAASWYTMGIMMALFSIGLYQFTYLQFSIAYAGMILLATVLINAVMKTLKK